MKNRQQLLTGSIWSLLLKFTLPAIVGMAGFALYNIVDRIFIGRALGTIALAAVGLSFPVFGFFIAVGMLIGIGGGTLVSLYMGAGEKEQANIVLGNVFILFLIISVVMVLAGIFFLEPLLVFFGAGPATMPYAKPYLFIILVSAVFGHISFGMNNIVRAEGSPAMAMNTMLIGAVVNTVLDYIFIFPLKMGVVGAAVATAIAQAISSAWIIYHFTLSPRRVLHLEFSAFRLRPDIIKRIFGIGLSPFFLQIAASFVTFLTNHSLLRYGGDIAVGAMGVINSVMMFVLMPTFGVNQGAQTIMGFNYGAGLYGRVRKTLIIACAAAAGIAIIGTAVLELVPGALVDAFGKGDLELRRIAIPGMRIFLLFLPLTAFQVIGANYFQAVGRPKKSIFLNILRVGLLFIPLVLILPRFFGIFGIWIAGPVSDFFSAIITLFFLFREAGKLSAGTGSGDIAEDDAWDTAPEA